jgi:hypothetical protein
MFDILVEDTLLVVVISIHKEMVVLQIHIVIHEIYAVIWLVNWQMSTNVMDFWHRVTAYVSAVLLRVYHGLSIDFLSLMLQWAQFPLTFWFLFHLNSLVA